MNYQCLELSWTITGGETLCPIYGLVMLNVLSSFIISSLPSNSLLPTPQTWQIFSILVQLFPSELGCDASTWVEV